MLGSQVYKTISQWPLSSFDLGVGCRRMTETTPANTRQLTLLPASGPFTRNTVWMCSQEALLSELRNGHFPDNSLRPTRNDLNYLHTVRGSCTGPATCCGVVSRKRPPLAWNTQVDVTEWPPFCHPSPFKSRVSGNTVDALFKRLGTLWSQQLSGRGLQFGIYKTYFTVQLFTTMAFVPRCL